jgi:hypothetical protein
VRRAAAEAEAAAWAALAPFCVVVVVEKTPLTKEASVEERVAETSLPVEGLVAARMIWGTRRGWRAAL